MPDHAGAGILIAVEGIDGSGKTTQVRMLAEALEASGEVVTTSKEPTGGRYGRKIRQSAAGERLPTFRELLNLVRDRRQHALLTIAPALERGEIVILDRYFYSTLAYQGARLASDMLDRLDKIVREHPPEPDVVFVLDMEPELALERIAARDGTPSSFEKIDTLTKVRAAFLGLCATDSKLVCLDATRSPEEIHQQIVEILRSGILRGRCRAKECG